MFRYYSAKKPIFRPVTIWIGGREIKRAYSALVIGPFVFARFYLLDASGRLAVSALGNVKIGWAFGFGRVEEKALGHGAAS